MSNPLPKDLPYSGQELDLFAQATNWKSYWSASIAPYLGDSVLDVGAGIGATARTLNTRTYRRWVELEPDRQLASRITESIQQGAMPPHYEIRNGTIRDISPFEQFDTILYIDVLEHIEDDIAELEAASQLVTIGGHVVILAPAHNRLFTEFDRQIGHYRRYDKRMLRQILPINCKSMELFYLDSVGLLASLGNRILLKSGSPTLAQILAWDRLMVPLSRWLDRLLMHRLGKSVIHVIERTS